MNAIKSILVSIGLRERIHDETTHSLLCMVDYNHLIAEADILVNN